MNIVTLKAEIETLTQQATSLYAEWQGVAQQLGQRQADLKQAEADLAAQIAQGQAGSYSSVDQLLRAERFAGKESSVDFVKASPTCSEAEASAAWTAAGISATGLQVLLVPAETYGAVYRQNLHAMGLIPDTTWESQRTWIVATDKTVIMGS